MSTPKHGYGWIPDRPDPSRRPYARRYSRMLPLRGVDLADSAGGRFFMNGFDGQVFVGEDGALNWSNTGLSDDKGGLVTFGVIAHGKDPAPLGAGFYPLQIVVADLNGNASGSVALSPGMKVGWSGETVKEGLVMDAYAYNNAASGPAGYSQPITVTIQVLHPPPSVDLRAGCGPVRDQNGLGACTAFAFADALAFLEVRDGLPPTAFSPLYIYYNERALEGTVAFDAGATLSDGIKSLSQGQSGACYESTWPYDVSQFANKPPSAAHAEGQAHQILVAESIRPVNNAYQLADMKDCLASGFPFVFGFAVFESFESAAVAQTGVVPMPAPGERIIGGHAVLCVGYDDASQRFTCQNSWGTGWGGPMNGFFTIPYAFLTASWPAYVSDLWTLRKGELMLA